MSLRKKPQRRKEKANDKLENVENVKHAAVYHDIAFARSELNIANILTKSH